MDRIGVCVDHVVWSRIIATESLEGVMDVAPLLPLEIRFRSQQQAARSACHEGLDQLSLSALR